MTFRRAANRSPVRAAAALALLALTRRAAATLSRGPYVVDASSTSAEICWRLGLQDSCRTYSGLAPATTFSYAVPGSTSAWSASSLPDAREPLSFAVIGDSGDGRKHQRRVAEILRKNSPQLILHVGDIVYAGGTDKDYDRKYFKPYADIISRTPVFTTLGNHDYGDFSSAEKGEKAFEAFYRRVHRRAKYYSFDAGPAHFVALDTNAAYKIEAGAPFGPDSEQRRWLEQDLAASKARWKFVFLHVPLYTTVLLHGDNAALRESLEPLFQKYGVDAVFQGHDHFYERSRPLGGVVYLTAGTGGAGLSRLVPERKADWVEKKIVGFGLLSARVDGSRLLVEFQDENGAVQDLLKLEKPLAGEPKDQAPEAVALKTEDGWTLSASYRPAQTGRPVAVLVHGAASGRYEWDRFASELWKLGIGTLALDLRGHGGSKQGPSGTADYAALDAAHAWPGAERDLEAALDYLRRRNVPASSVGLIGASIGANLATQAAAVEPRVPWVVLLSPGENYRGVGLAPLPGRKLLVAASLSDPYAYAAAEHLASSGAADAFLEARRGHGVQMFEEAAFLKKLLDWIKTASAGG